MGGQFALQVQSRAIISWRSPAGPAGDAGLRVPQGLSQSLGLHTVRCSLPRAPTRHICSPRHPTLRHHLVCSCTSPFRYAAAQARAAKPGGPRRCPRHRPNAGFRSGPTATCRQASRGRRYLRAPTARVQPAGAQLRPRQVGLQWRTCVILAAAAAGSRLSPPRTGLHPPLTFPLAPLADAACRTRC